MLSIFISAKLWISSLKYKILVAEKIIPGYFLFIDSRH